LLDDAVAHHDDPVGDRQRFFQVVGHVDRRDVEPALQLLQLHAPLRAQLASRFDSGSSKSSTEGEKPVVLASRSS
jgi:hypothetical protein